MTLPNARRHGTRTVNDRKMPVYEIDWHFGLWVKTDLTPGERLTCEQCQAVLTYRGTKREFVFERVI